jgi:O-antigen/teichoic acid export membrane protein
MQVKRGVKNIFFGFLSQLATILLGLVLPKLFITSYGSDMNGLISSVNQIFVYLALFEAGVGTATLVALYGPVGAGNKQKINSILSATNIYYKRAGIFYLGAMIVFAAVYPYVVTTGINTITVSLVILLTGIVGVINFFTQGKYQLLLQAEGKNYISVNLNIIVNILTNIAKIALLLAGFNVLTVQLTFVIFSMLQVLFITCYIKKNYQWLDLKVQPDFQAISQKNSVLIHQISSLIFSNTDVLVLTFFTNLKVVSVYALYTLLFGAIGMAINNISNGLMFILGQTFNDDMDRYKRIHNAYELYFLAIIYALFAIAFVFILPFLKRYTAGITDINYIDKYLPVLFVAVNLLSYSRSTASMLVNYAGHFKETKWRSIIESIINLTSSLLFVNLLGIYGVLIGTVIALLYRTNDLIIYANRHILKRSPWITYRRCLLDLALFFIVVLASSLLSIQFETYASIFIGAIIYCAVIIPVFILVNLLLEKDIRQYSLALMRPYIRRLLKKA